MKSAAVRPLFLAFFVPVSTLALRAAPVATATGDIILGFKATDSPGGTTNLEVNLGPASNFYGAAPGSVTVLTNLSVLDLKAVYGDNWATREDLTWGFVGTTGLTTINGVPARTLWASRAEPAPGTKSTPWPRSSQFTLQVSSNAMLSLYTDAPGSLGNAEATANSPFSANVDASQGGSWTIQEGFDPGVSFRYFNPTVMSPVKALPGPGSAYDGTTYTVLDLWEVRPGAPGAESAHIGGIGLNSEGKLVFSTDISKFAPPSTGVELGQPAIAYSGTGSATVTLQNVPGGNYALDRTTTLAAGGWTTLFTQSPVSSTLVYTDPAPPAGRAYYRIRKTP